MTEREGESCTRPKNAVSRILGTLRRGRVVRRKTERQSGT